MRKVTILIAAIALAIPSVALAQDDDEGWFIGIEGGSVQAGGADLALADPIDGNGDFIGNRIFLDYGSGTVYGAQFGYQSGDSRYAVSYWQYDEDEALSASTNQDFINLLNKPFIGIQTSQAIEAMGELESSVIDLTWSRTINEQEKSAFDWTIGLRQWSLDQMTAVDYDDTGTIDTVTLTSEAQGIGVTAGLGASVRFNEWLWGSTNLDLAFLTGDIDSRVQEEIVGTVLYDVLVDGVDRNFFQAEIDTRLNFDVVDGLNLFVGYQYKQFNDAASEFGFFDGFGSTRDLSFAGFTAGGTFTF